MYNKLIAHSFYSTEFLILNKNFHGFHCLPITRLLMYIYMKQHRSFTLFPPLDQGGDVLGALKQKAVLGKFNPLIPMSDQDRISPYYMHTISSRQVMRIEKNIN